MDIIIDIEASGLGSQSYPVEIAWASAPHYEVTSHLIRPLPGWLAVESAWDRKAEKLHGLSRELLLEEGRCVYEVSEFILASFVGADLYSDSPEFDEHWLNMIIKHKKTSFSVRDIEDIIPRTIDAATRRKTKLAAFRGSCSRHRAGTDVLSLVNYVKCSNRLI